MIQRNLGSAADVGNLAKPRTSLCGEFLVIDNLFVLSHVLVHLQLLKPIDRTTEDNHATDKQAKLLFKTTGSIDYQ